VPRVRGLSVDEYPFACTMQGGSGAWIGHVPPGEQLIQGGVISSFLQRNGLQAGDTFHVVVGH
jgi:hypothetical protein